MHYILLIGAGYNFIGCLKLLKELFISAPPLETDNQEYYQLKLFVAGVAVTFGALYVYLFFYPQYIFPILIFGAGLKSWAFLGSLYLYLLKRLDLKTFFDFGITNGVIACLFWALILYLL